MSDYFDRLEIELRAAVPRAAANPELARRRHRVSLGGAVAAFSVAVAVAVAALAVVLLGHGRMSAGPPAPTSTTGRSVATVQQLVAEFAVLRRPQTAADRWRPAPVVPSAARVLPRLTRLARSLSDGERVYVGVEQLRGQEGNHGAAGYSLGVWVTGPGIGGGSGSFSPTVGYTEFPLPLGMHLDHGTRAAVPTWVGIVPDGVKSVRWVFHPRDGSRADDVDRRPVTINLPAVGNVAAARVAGTSTADPVGVVWYDTEGRPIKSYNSPGPAPQTLPGGGSAYCVNSTTGARTACSPSKAPAPTERGGFAAISPHPGSPSRLAAQLQLDPPSGARRPVAVGRVVEQGGDFGITILGVGLPANTKRNAYALWLINGKRQAQLLGFVNPAVAKNGKLKAAGILPKHSFRYHELLITLETTSTPETPGRVILEGSFHR